MSVENKMEDFKRQNDLVKNVPKNFVPHISDLFVYSGIDNASIAVVKQMVRESDHNEGGYVIYEQYINTNGKWVQYPEIELKKSFVGFISRYIPFKETVDHIIGLREEEARQEAYVSDVLTRNGFPNFKENKEKYKDNPQFLELYGKASIEAIIISLKKEDF